VLKRGFKWKPK